VAVDAAAVEQLDVNGYTVLENVIDAAWLEQMRAAFEALSAAEGRLAGHEARENLRYVCVCVCVCVRACVRACGAFPSLSHSRTQRC